MSDGTVSQRVLWVDDELDFSTRNLSKMLKEKQNISIDYAQTISGALDKLRSTLYNLVITDLYLPNHKIGSFTVRHGGLVLLNEMRSGKLGPFAMQYRLVPVIFLTQAPFEILEEVHRQGTTNVWVFGKFNLLERDSEYSDEWAFGRLVGNALRISEEIRNQRVFRLGF